MEEGEGDGEEAAEESAKKRRGKSQEKRSEDALKNYSTVGEIEFIYAFW